MQNNIAWAELEKRPVILVYIFMNTLFLCLKWKSYYRCYNTAGIKYKRNNKPSEWFRPTKDKDGRQWVGNNNIASIKKTHIV